MELVEKFRFGGDDTGLSAAVKHLGIRARDVSRDTPPYTRGGGGGFLPVPDWPSPNLRRRLATEPAL